MQRKSYSSPLYDPDSLRSELPSLQSDTFFSLSILHHIFSLILANTAVLPFLLLCSSRFSSYCYTQRQPTPTQKSARNWQLRPFSTSCAKDGEGHSLVQTSFTEPSNRSMTPPIHSQQGACPHGSNVIRCSKRIPGCLSPGQLQPIRKLDTKRIPSEKTEESWW